MFARIDTFLLDRVFTPIAWWFERATGRTNFFLAWWAIALSTLCLFFMADIQFVILHQWGWFDIVFYAIFLIGGIGRMLMYGKNDHTARTAPSQIAFRDSRSVSPFGPIVRVLWCLFVIPDTMSALGLFSFGGANMSFFKQVATIGFDITYISAWYFADVMRPPPKPRREEAEEPTLVPVVT